MDELPTWLAWLATILEIIAIIPMTLVATRVLVFGFL